jgi:PAS domain S-box-containing protein
MTDAEGRITYVSRHLADMLVHAPAELLGRAVSELVFENDRDALLIGGCKNAAGRQFELRMKRKNAQPLWVHISCDPMLGQEGELTGIIVVVTDISERKSLERQKELAAEAELEASRAKDAFLARLSHELRTPLASIRGWVRMIRAGKLKTNESGIYKALAIIERNAELQDEILRDLHDLTRISHGELKAELRPMDLRDVVEAAVETVRPEAEAKGIAIKTVLPHTKALVNGDSLRLQQVMWNLLSNAVRFTPPGGSVVVVQYCQDDRACASVQDSGCGIPADQLTNIFDAYFKGKSSQGLGLGLSIAAHIVQLHNGTIRAESEGEGRGARFSLCLPRLQD